VAVPFHLRRFRVSPMLGMGIGWLRGTDYTNEDNNVAVPEAKRDLTARVDLSLATSVPLGRGFSLSGVLATQMSSSTGSNVSSGDEVAVVQPAVFFRFGLGLLWGAP
jgi:pantoate kinase